jgi:hypothetical protein
MEPGISAEVTDSQLTLERLRDPVVARGVHVCAVRVELARPLPYQGMPDRLMTFASRPHDDGAVA